MHAPSLQSLIQTMIPVPVVCLRRANDLRRAHPGLSDHELAREAVWQAKTLLAAIGAGTGLVTSPFAMVPLALSEIGVVLHREASLAGLIAALLEPESLEDERTFNADILAILMPGAVTEAIGQVVVGAGQQSTKIVIRKIASQGGLKPVTHLAAKFLGVRLSQRAIITKGIPVVGAVIGAAWNWGEVHMLGKRAIEYFSERPEALRRRSFTEPSRWLPQRNERNEPSSERIGWGSE